MNRWRQRSATGLGPKPRTTRDGRTDPAIDLGLSLSVYGLGVDGEFVELSEFVERHEAAMEAASEPRPIRVPAWPTEQ